MRERREIFIAAALVLAILICYVQVSDHEFVNYDDHRYITRNVQVQQGLTWESLAWAFTTLDVANWHPLTWLSHMLDFELYGLANPGGHHLTNLFFHIANSLLLMFLLRRMTGCVWRSAAVAALFALHPLHVESVAWVSERKDVLSTFFGFLAIWAYTSYTKQPSIARYAAVAFLFAFSLMSKPMLVTLPALLLVLDYWPLKRFQISNLKSQIRKLADNANGRVSGFTVQNPRFLHLIIEKLPLLALSCASSVITLIAQSSGGAVSSLDALSLGGRISNALVAYMIYMRQTIWPHDLAALYPLQKQWPIVTIALAFILFAGISAIAVYTIRRFPHVITGWLWYVGTLVPVIGLVQVGSQAHADRYTYVPLIGLFIAIVWSIPAARSRSRTVAYAVASGLTFGVLMLLTHLQTQHWRNSIALCAHAIRVTENNGVMHFNMANALVDKGEFDRAITYFQRTAEIMPHRADVLYNMANTLGRTGRLNEAIAAYDEAIRRDPQFASAWVNRGVVLAQQSDKEQAIASFHAALKINPDNPDAHLNLGQTLAGQNQLDEAILHFNRALQVRPNDAVAHLLLGNALARQGRFEQALGSFARSLQLNPNEPRAHMSMAAALEDLGRIEQAAQHLHMAAELAQAAGQQTLLGEIIHRLQRLQSIAPPPAPVQP